MKSSFYALFLLICESYNEIIVLNTGKEKLYNFFPLQNGNLDFAVSATNDVHILLTDIPKLEEPYYEIVLGGWGDKKSVIRYNQLEQVEYNSAVLEKQYFSTFSVKVNFTEGSLSVFRGKNVKPFMHFVDPNFIDVTYFGLSTGFGSTGIFHFGNRNVKCPMTQNVNNYYSVHLNEE